MKEKTKISVSGHKMLIEDIEKLRKEVRDGVSATNKDNQESQDAYLAQIKLNKLEEILNNCEIVERDKSVKKIQIGDIVTFKAFFDNKENKHEKIMDSYARSVNCVLIKEFIGKEKGYKIPRLGNMENIEILKFSQYEYK